MIDHFVLLLLPFRHKFTMLKIDDFLAALK